jgi:deazaflavin-dependent oxidoreductase (nitroreductase family)
MMDRRAVPRMVPLLNRVAKPLVAAGMPMGPNGLLTVRGRTSGEPRSTPLAIIEADGRRWIWSPWGDVHWVRNLRAAGTATITLRRAQQDVRAVELDPQQRVAFFRDTFGPVARGMPFGVRFVRLLDGVDVDDPVAAAKGRAVFELHTVI